MKKRIAAILLLMMLLAAIIPTTSLAATASTKYSKSTVYRTTASSLNLRSSASASTKKNIIGSLPRGTAFTVSSSKGNWYKIKVLRTGKVGWVSKSYTSKIAYARVTTKNQGLNVRTGPGTGYTLINSMPKGAINVQVKYIHDNWAYVKYNKLEGWASRTYLAWMY